MGLIRTFIVAVYLVFFILLCGPLLMLYAAVTRSGDLLYRGGLGGVLVIFRAMGIRVRAEGVENIPAGACLFVANHTSNADPPAIMSCIPRRLAILAKRSLFAIPVVGKAFRMGGFVPVDRERTEAAIASMDLAAEHIKHGMSFLVYPEGTRSPDGRLLRFKAGAFALAIKAGAPIVPVACAGAHRIMPKDSWRITPGDVVVRFCPAVDASKYRFEDRRKLAEVVRRAIASALPPEQKPLD